MERRAGAEMWGGPEQGRDWAKAKREREREGIFVTTAAHPYAA